MRLTTKAVDGVTHLSWSSPLLLPRVSQDFFKYVVSSASDIYDYGVSEEVSITASSLNMT